ncbi:MAG: ATP-dependent DNA helicase [Bacteroidetes bacterium]|nr:ATP-dependent DNA helicase [Bacteroidota bacterium]
MSLVELAPQEALKEFFGFDEFKGEQEKAIRSVLDGRDTFVIMPTGGGKSMCYQLPALMLDGVALVISPLIALMKNQVDAIRGHHEDKRVAHFLNSSLAKSEAERVKQEVAEGWTKLLYVAPESLTKAENIEFLKSVRISFVAVDEAHCISEWGHDFRPEYRRIKPIIKGIADVPIMALTATATPKVQQDIQKNLDMVDAVVLKSSFNRDNLFYEIRPKKEALKQIVRHCLQNVGKSGIVYCLSRKKVEQIADTLRVNGVKALAYHAGMDSHQRSSIQDQFLMQDVDVIVATIAFGMGIDKPDVRFVIHYDMPKSLESYYQETGRAGRDGGEGRCIAFYSHKDIDKLEKFLQGKPIAEQEVGMQLLQEVMAYAETATSRRKFLLHYFGEEFDEVNGPGAMNCDNSLNPPTLVDRQEEVHLLLSAVLEHNHKHRMGFFTSLLTATENRQMADYGVIGSAFWGRGNEHDLEFWQGIVRQTVVLNYLEKEVEKYGVLHLTEKGKSFVASPGAIMLANQRDFTDVDSGDSLSQTHGASGGALDPKLRGMLTELRKKVSAEKGLPPYVIFQDISLDEMATHYPINPDELLRITGVGSGKAAKFGEPFTKLIAQYVDEEGIERDDSLLVRSSGSKSSNKVTIIQLLDRKMGLDDIAAGIHGQRAQVLEEIEAIVSAGTKVSLDHILEESLDDECLEELFEFFSESEDESLVAAREEFEDAYSEEELRLARIKFLCEVAH